MSAHSHTTETDDAMVPRALQAFIRRRLMELAGLVLLALATLLTVSLASWSALDPSLDRAVDTPVRNLLGWSGAVVSDLLLSQAGLAAILLVAMLIYWAMRWMTFTPPARHHARVLWLLAAIMATAGFLAALPTPANWPLQTGLGGNLGAALFNAFRNLLGLLMHPLPATIGAATLLLVAAVFATVRAAGITGEGIVRAAGVLGDRRQEKVARGIGGLAHARMWLAGQLRRKRREPRMAKPPAPARNTPAQDPARPPVRRPARLPGTTAAPDAMDDDADRPPIAAFAPRSRDKSGTWRLAGLGAAMRAPFARLAGIFATTGTEAEEEAHLHAVPPAAPSARREPSLPDNGPAPLQRHEPRLSPAPAYPGAAAEAGPEPASTPACPPATPAPAAMSQTLPADAPEVTIGAPVDSAFLPEDPEAEAQTEPQPAPAPAAITAPAPRTAKRAAPPQAPAKAAADIELPPLDILALPRPEDRQAAASDEELQENAATLEQVLEDFGVRGRIVNVCPGPVVTLYEFEPAPGIKSSRVIGLADDIARSMCAISARIAVVPGRNVIGIELPNERRETVYLREMLQSKGYRKSKFNLPLALGKNIAGDPVFADLARMPHLLIAGTTGSGKSVGINTFIMSLLYKLRPEQCRLIMIDPKMLELSIYEGIPHLLSPVVTDPKKAVVALKWAVREMEDRYQKMAKLGVRNLDGYNARVKEAIKNGEVITRTIQTGFDPDTGEPVFEEKEMELEVLPWIVIIIDEMADLMMVAGKDIEGAVQRLAQMARAAGIHVVMATQRPSVDVITGTIKANFPTRISFQVTSKIDGRTILGEQGAEQLLGMGDMLYMAGGGRIVRLHGPFVSDDEVEHVFKHLKSQAEPDYVEAVIKEADDGAPGASGGAGGGAVGNSGNELYDKAVQVVLRDKKVSTSYIQRRLQIGYNKAATLIERMEEEGLISAPNSKGRREILVGGDSAN